MAGEVTARDVGRAMESMPDANRHGRFPFAPIPTVRFKPPVGRLRRRLRRLLRRPSSRPRNPVTFTTMFDPECRIVAPMGSWAHTPDYSRVWVKESGSGNTCWVAK